jgi:RNA-splicing ligase RtcB
MQAMNTNTREFERLSSEPTGRSSTCPQTKRKLRRKKKKKQKKEPKKQQDNIADRESTVRDANTVAYVDRIVLLDGYRAVAY